jgi:chaperonin GroES
MIRPLADFVLIKPDKAEEITKSGILLSSLEDKKSMYGTVVAVGPGKELSNGQIGIMEVKSGDRVAYERYGGDDIKDGEEEYIILNQPRIFCIIK